MYGSVRSLGGSSPCLLDPYAQAGLRKSAQPLSFTCVPGMARNYVGESPAARSLVEPKARETARASSRGAGSERS